MKYFIVIFLTLISPKFIRAQNVQAAPSQATIDANFITVAVGAKNYYVSKILQNNLIGAKSGCDSYGLRIGIPTTDSDAFLTAIVSATTKLPAWLGIVYDETSKSWLNMVSGAAAGFTLPKLITGNTAARCVKVLVLGKKAYFYPGTTCLATHNLICEDVI